jgi:uncharacterized protein (DUF2252 family)
MEIDRLRTADFPHLLAHKADRMRLSPLALLRGSGPLFYEVLARHPALAEGPPGAGWLVGDAHIENFGAYRTGKLSVRETEQSHAREPVVFDLNDFDDAFVGPWRLDVLRLLTSLVLGARESGADGAHTIELADALIGAYVKSALHGLAPPAAPAVVRALTRNVRTRTRKALLEARTEVVHGARRFARGAHFLELPKKLVMKAERAFARYVGSLAKRERPVPDAFRVIDTAFRVAGTGSLGCLRIAVLVRGKGGVDGGWIFDMKAEGRPSAHCLVRAPKIDPAERVCKALVECLAQPPALIGRTHLRGESMFVRRLMPQEDKIEFGEVSPGELMPLVRHFGALLGAGHRRGAMRTPKASWTEKDRAGLVSRALALAGLHEAMYLAYCRISRR